jgi:hypothetical protein
MGRLSHRISMWSTTASSLTEGPKRRGWEEDPNAKIREKSNDVITSFYTDGEKKMWWNIIHTCSLNVHGASKVNLRDVNASR